MNEQLERIKTKFRELKTMDEKLHIFGANVHKYHLNPVLDSHEISDFESKYQVTLPPDYKAFLLNFANGGAGPYYGVEAFENVLFDDLDYKRADSLLNPSLPFPHSKAWNEVFEASVDPDENEEEYERQYEIFSQHLMDGSIAICNYGCGVSLHLIVNGDEYGQIWTDDRGSDAGIYPSYELGNQMRISFLDWYELWLDNSIAELKEEMKTEDNKTEEKVEQPTKHSWWKKLFN